MKDIRSHRAVVTIGAGIWLLALTGCATAAGGAGATAAPSATSEPGAPAATPTETAPGASAEPTSQPSQDPGDVESWTISEDGSGPFELGMSWDETVALAEELGWDTSSAETREGCAAFVAAPLEARVEMYAWNYDGETAEVSVAALPELATSGPATAEGITPQSMFDDVRAAYPDAEPGETPIAGHPYLTVDADGAGGAMYFAADGDALDLISVNTLGTIPYEHC